LMDYIFSNARRLDRRVVIYGTGEAGTAALHALQEGRNLLTVVGFLDDEESKSHFHDLPVMRSAILNATPRNFDEIVLATEKIPEKTFWALSTRCRLAKIPLKRFSVDCTEVDPASFATMAPQPQRRDSQMAL
jgi:FlaA1/EpsC-like NDP-sugar epimerase